jgi:imidazolonepropionase-like amidohydrolase
MTPSLAQPPAAPSVFAIVGAKIEIGDGRIIEKGTVVLRDGLIAAVGADVKAPPDAEIIKGDGLVIYPGFVDAYSARGLKLPEAQADQDVKPDTDDTAPAFMREANRKGVRPELRAVDHLELTDPVLNSARRVGFTTAHLAPAGGIINGVTGVVNLSGLPKRNAVVKGDIALDCGWRAGGAPGGPGAGPPGGSGYPGSLMGVIAHFRQTMLDAQHFRLTRTAFEKRGGPRPPADNTLTALLPVLDRAQPVLFDADTENQVHRAIKLADEFHLRLMVNGGAEAWKMTDTLKKRNIPVLLSLSFGPEPGARPQRPDTPRPDRDDRPSEPADPSLREDENRDVPPAALEERKGRWSERVACAGALHKAGIPFAFSTKGLRDVNEFLPNLRRAIKAGLPREAALQSLTLNAARILGLEKQLGTVEAGKIAALTIMNGDFAEERTRARYLFIDGVKFDLERATPGERPRTRPMPVEDDEDGHPHP